MPASSGRTLGLFTRLFLFSAAAVLGLAAGKAEAGSYKVGSFAKTTAGAPASQVVPHGLGVAPKAIIFWTEGKTNEAFGASSLFAFGVTDGATSASSATGAQDAAGPTFASNRMANKALTIVQGGGATLAEADLTSWNATSFTLNWTTNDAGAYVIHFIAIGGPTISAKVVLWNAPLVTGNLAVNTVGFQPDVVIHSMTRQVTSPATGAEGAFVLGVSAGTGANQWSNSIYSSGGSPSTTQRAQSTAASLHWVRAGAIARQAAFVSMNPLGFTLNHTTVDAVNAHQVFSLALGGMQVRAGNFNKVTGAAPAIQTVSPLTLQPRVVLLSSVQNVTAAGSVAEARYGIGASDGTSEGSSAFQDQNAQATSNVDGIDKTSKAFVKVNNATQAVDAEADMLGFGENSFMLDWTTNDAVATQMVYLALGDVTTYVRSIGTAAAYTQGTVTVTRGSTTVTGGGAPAPDWVTANQGRGDRITITGQGTFTVAGVTGATSLVLTSPFTGTSGTYGYSIARNFTGPEAWYDCVDGTTACTPAGGANLVTTRRREVGVMYKEGHTAWTGSTWDTATTSATYDITLTADPGNRHLGVFGGGTIFNTGGNSIRAYNSYMTFEWLEFRGGSPRVFHISNAFGSPNKLTVRYCLFHSTATSPLVWFSGQHDADVYNNIFHANDGIDIDLASTVNIYNNTFYNLTSNAVVSTAGNTVTLRNNVALGCTGGCYSVSGGAAAGSSNNLASDATGTTHSPAGGGLNSIIATASPTVCGDPEGCVGFQTIGATPNLHLIPTTYANRAVDTGATIASIAAADIDATIRGGTWDRGADELGGTTVVRLASLTARGSDSSVLVEWETASELSNLGFHLYRADAADGPYTRITSSLIAGLGSSVTGRSYSYRDEGLVNGRTYYYELEDVETSGRTERHGPVSATPVGTTVPPPGASGTSYGDASSVVLREVERSSGHVVLELRTGGFWATPTEDGRVHLQIPGFESGSRPGEPRIPTRRALVEAAAGRKVWLTSVLATDAIRFPGLRPETQGAPAIEVDENGIVLPSEEKRGEGRAFRELFPSESALLLGTSFQGETKKAEVVFSPLRWDGDGLVLSRRLLVRLDFSGREVGETSQGGSRGRRRIDSGTDRAGVVAQLVTRERGLYRVSYEDIFPAGEGQRRRPSVPTLRLSRKGESVVFHVEPGKGPFGPGSFLYFLSEGSSLNPYGDAVYELETSGQGPTMEVDIVSSTSRSVSGCLQEVRLEENHYYQAGLLEAPDPWQWDVMVSPGSRSYGFTVEDLSASPSKGRLWVELQGASDFEAAVDHHVRVRVNGQYVGETSWDGKLPRSQELELDPGVLREGTNVLELEDVGDTGAAYSMVFLNRFKVSYPRRLTARGGTLEGRFEETGRADVEGASASSVVLDTTGVPRWVRGASATRRGLSLPVQEGRSYLLTSTFRRPEVRPVGGSRLRKPGNRAEYLLLAPQAFLGAAQPLLDLRKGQGLVTKAVSLEDVYEQFGHGEVNPGAIKAFLEYAYHSWSRPSVRYVVLLGDASYDPKDYLQTGVKDWLPGYPMRTSYLWTVSDPAYASVNGKDRLPDVAIGRLPAASATEAERLVQKLLSYENGGGRFDGPAVLVADNSDLAGNFEGDAEEIANGVLASRNPKKIYYSQEGASTRAKITKAFDEGASLMSYVGHGATAVWASENIFNFRDVKNLAPQSQQPFLMTMNCLNGFFQFPPLNSLSEELLKAEGKGVVGAFSPSGLSVEQAAHVFHKILLEEIVSGRHERIGDAILAAQERYAARGAFPELLSIYHLLGDPALPVQP